MKIFRDLIAMLESEIDGEIGARDSFDEGTPEYCYHDGYSEGLVWALERLKKALE